MYVTKQPLSECEIDYANMTLRINDALVYQVNIEMEATKKSIASFKKSRTHNNKKIESYLNEDDCIEELEKCKALKVSLDEQISSNLEQLSKMKKLLERLEEGSQTIQSLF